MGNEHQKLTKLHLIQYKWKGNNDIDLKAESDQFHQKDFLITESGSLIVYQKQHEHHFLKNY